MYVGPLLDGLVQPVLLCWWQYSEASIRADVRNGSDDYDIDKEILGLEWWPCCRPLCVFECEITDID